MTKNFLIFLLAFTFVMTITTVNNSESISGNNTVNLVNDSVIWDTRNYATFDRMNGSLNLAVDLNKNETIYNRIYAILDVPDSTSPHILDLSYITNSSQGNPRFIVETRVNNTGPLPNYSSSFLQYYDFYNEKPSIHSIDVGNTLGYLTNRTYELPHEISNTTTEIRFYIITNEPSTANFVIKNATIVGN